MRSTQQLARVAGFLYLPMALIAPIGLLYVPGKLIVTRDAAATAANSSLLALGVPVIHMTGTGVGAGRPAKAYAARPLERCSYPS